MSHVLVVANETVTGPSLIEAREAPAPRISSPSLRRSATRHTGYVVYEDTRRAAAGRRLDRTLAIAPRGRDHGPRARRRGRSGRRGARRDRDARADARPRSSSRRIPRRSPAGCGGR